MSFRFSRPVIGALLSVGVVTAVGSPANANVDMRHSPPANIKAGQLWDSNNCLDNYVAANGNVIATSPTNLCRAPYLDNNHTFYYVFPRGQTQAQWIEALGTYNDGYLYWTYRGLFWLRRPNNGGDAQIKVVNQDGSTSYEDLPTWEAHSPDGYADMLKESQSEQAALDIERQSYTTTPQSSNLTSDQLQAAQNQIAQQNQQIRQLEDQVKQQQTQDQTQQQSQSNNAQFIAQEQEFLAQENAKMLEVWTEPACDASFNGCAP